MRTLLSAIALPALLIAAPAHANEDVQGWTGVVAQGAVKGDLYIWLEGQARFTDEIGQLGQFILRPAAGIRFAPDASAIAGYAYVQTRSPAGLITREHRPWQQVQFALLRNRAGKPVVTSRTRLEQRMVEGRTKTGWRLRQFVRAGVPITRGGVQAVAFSEGFFNLNTTDFGARSGVDQWRTFVGIGLPVGKTARIEPGYLNQRVFRRGEDRTNHVLNATLFVSL
ncbi:DUF2490 domain-containing protein [Sphingomonas sp. Leaf33]|uniref:DUF2490 domain-containing protein n=1 Tax=Sphingomonas sp. Leaf33 TaxID=1736215 RepID=UPI000AFF5CF0|nr:DUF2490 domain-containing protein [Sphingomonas sp. Leaf33]